MVSGFQDELDPSDNKPNLLPPSKDVILTSDEDDVPAAPVVRKDQDFDSEPELKA